MQKYRRRKKLIKPRLQLKFALIFLSTAGTAVLVQAIMLTHTLTNLAYGAPNDGRIVLQQLPKILSLILGITCAAWHIPAFLLSGSPLSDWSFVPYFGGVIAIYVILTPFFNVSKGSLLIAYLYHFQMMNPIFPDAQPYDNIIWMGVAVIVVWLNRDKMFRRGEGVTEVLMPEKEDAPAAARYRTAARQELPALAISSESRFSTATQPDRLSGLIPRVPRGFSRCYEYVDQSVPAVFASGYRAAQNR